VGTYRTDDERIEELRDLPSVTLYRINLAHADAFASVRDEIDTIVHVAAVSPTDFVTVDDMIACNVVGTQNVHSFALRKGATRFIFMSSVSVYGNVTASMLTETTPLLDPHPYGASKFMCERVLAARSTDLPTIALRLPGILGRNAHRAWVPTVVHRALSGDDIIYYNPESPFNNAIHVEDISTLCLSLTKKSWSGFHAFPLAASTAMSVRDVIELIVSSVGSKSRIRVGAPKQDGFVISSAYAARHFDYTGSPIDDVLRKYCSDPGRPQNDALMGL
jgi:nucleoside-diphosphate-sugar epimerase